MNLPDLIAFLRGRIPETPAVEDPLTAANQEIGYRRAIGDLEDLLQHVEFTELIQAYRRRS